MAYWDIGMRHIVDVNGQLLAIDAELIDPATLLARANCPADSRLYFVRAGERHEVEPRRLLRLSHDEVLFFETLERVRYQVPDRLAA